MPNRHALRGQPKVAAVSARQTAFTLMGLIVVVAITAIIAVLATPSFINVIQGNRLTADATALAVDLAYAQSEAVKRRQAVTLCPRDSDSSCARGGNPWDHGWLVFTDINRNGEPNTGSGACRITPTAQEDCVLRVKQEISGGNTISLSPNLSAITYRADGTAAAATDNLVFSVCTDRAVTGKREKQIIVSVLGNVSINKEYECP